MQKLCLLLPSRGIGDALLMTPLAEYYFQKGYAVTLVHKHLGELSRYFPHITFAKEASNADLVIIQNDNKREIPEGAFVFYPSYEAHRHPPLKEGDIVCDPKKPIVESFPSKETGIKLPTNLKKIPGLIAIHPTSAERGKNWSPTAFVKVAKGLIAKGKKVFFAVAPHEHGEWAWVKDHGIELPYFPTLSQTAEKIYASELLIGNDSALGHLASALGLPTIIIANCSKRMRLWRPGFFPGHVVTPGTWIPNIKGLRLRDHYWNKLINYRSVLKLIEN